MRKRKELEFPAALQNFENLEPFVLKVDMEYYRHDRMDWRTTSMPLCKNRDPNDCKGLIRSLNGTGSAELVQYSYKVSFT